MKNKFWDIFVYVIYGIIFLGIIGILYFLAPHSEDFNSLTILGNVVQLIAPFFAGFAIIFLFNPRIFGDSERAKPWLFIGLGLLAWALGQLAYTYMEVFQGIEVPDISYADIGFLLLYVFVIIGYVVQFKLFGRFKVPSTLFHLLLLAFIGCYLYLEWGSLTSAAGLGLAIQIAYVVGDIIFVLGAAMLAYTNRNGFLMWPWIILAVSAFLFAFGNALFDFLSLQDLYVTGSFVDLFWVTAFIIAWIGAHLYNSLMSVRLAKS